MACRELTLYIDGASQGNPGASGIGVVLCDSAGNLIKEINEYIGITTNNVAEYRALIRGLIECLSLGCESVKIFSDSELLVKQLKREYRVKEAHLKQFYGVAKSILDKIKKAEISHISKEQNKRADKLANLAIEEYG